MANRRSAPVEAPEGEPILLVSRDEFTAQITQRIQLGLEQAKQPINSPEEYEAARASYYSWSAFNKTLITKRVRNSKALLREYEGSAFGVFSMGGSTLRQDVADLTRDYRDKIDTLKSFVERAELFDEEVAATTPPALRAENTTGAIPNKLDIFIVHGRDDHMKLDVKNTLTNAGANCIILHEQPDKGRGILEKLLDHSKDAKIAVVLLSPDDKGYLADDEPSSASYRARQNVILELGLFIGILGKEKVFVLYKEEPGKAIDLPSDYHGILFKPYKAGGGWPIELNKELKELKYRLSL